MAHELSRQQSLKSEKQIQKLFNLGKSVFVYPIKAQILLETLPTEGSTCLEIAITVPKKKIKRAVDRNLLKRRTREAFRVNKSGLEAKLQESSKKLSIMFIYVALHELTFQDIQESMLQILKKVEKKVG